MFNFADSSPSVADSTFSGNTADYGGAMYNSNSSPEVTGCSFEINWGLLDGGAMYNSNSSPTVTDCSFGSNTAYHGGGMYNLTSSPIVTGCTFTGNTAGVNGGGMYNYDSSSPTVTRCTFSDNWAANGGGMYNVWHSSPMVINCAFNGNTAIHWGGGMYNYFHAGPAVTNCTFSDNMVIYYGGGGMCNEESGNFTVANCLFTGNASAYGGAMHNISSSPTVTNCILWNDAADEIFNAGSAPVVTYCDVQGGWTGLGNIDAAPLFRDPIGPDGIPGTGDEDWRLSPGSPCIDAGDNTAVPLDVADLDGDGDTSEATPIDLDGYGRFVDDPATIDTGVPGNGYVEVVDMGAYEYQPQATCPADVNGDAFVDVLDLLAVLAAWGATSGPEDINGDGVVDVLDLLALLSAWGPCA
jgi:parallel beta-helix repeat protein